MKKYLLKRVFYMALTLFLVATITFFLMKLMPGYAIFKPRKNVARTDRDHEPTIRSR